MEKAEVIKSYRNLLTEVLRLDKYGMKEEREHVLKAILGISKATKVPVPNFFKEEKESTEKQLREIYAFTGRKDKRISKSEIRAYAKTVLGKGESLATRMATDKSGFWLYRALLYKLIEPVEGDAKEWSLKITI